jgi:hypothetical protein
MFACIHICCLFRNFQSYIVDMDINKDPTVPPPSYEEATDRKEPSAPYYQ